MKNLKDKVAFVTGGTRGMGAAIVKRLSAEGANVVFTHSGKNPSKASKVLGDIRANGTEGESLVANNQQPAELTDALEQTTQQFGSVDILVNNAGIFIVKPIWEYTLDEYDRMMDIHVKAVFVASQYAANYMPDSGRIITIGSNLADRIPGQGASLYGMSKSALVGLTKGIARDLGDKNITANLIQPGPTNTDMNPETTDFADFQKQFMAIDRFGTVDEIAGLVAYLAGAESQFITGTTITIDGGFNI